MSTTCIVKSFYRESLDFHTLCNYQVLRAGHIVSGSDYRISRHSLAGHEFIYCLRGAGWIEFSGGKHYVHQNQLAWLPLKGAHTHYPDAGQPWEIYWLRIDGGKLDNLVDFLQVSKQPAFLLEERDSIISLFHAFFAEMAEHSFLSDVRCDELVSRLLGILTRVRSEVNKMTQDPVRHKGLVNLIHEIQSHYAEEWDIDRIAAECNVSKSQLFRLFHSTFGLSPLKWLKSYRLSQARRLLVDSDHSVSEVAYGIGYKDPLHFSRDFKRAVGTNPSQFRIMERQQGYEL